MSNFLAIATVTAVLRDLLQEAAGAAVPGATVTTRRPESVTDSGQHKPAVNIFLYLVAPNAAWRNTDITIRYADPERVEKRPQTPLNLNYLFSFYGNELEFEPQRLLGSAVSTLHAQPRITAQAIQTVVARERALQGSDLAFQVSQVENVTLTPVGLSLEELSKLWSVFFQVPYALSIAYVASTVLIESGSAHGSGTVRTVNIEPPEVLP
jgi:hypothetical protein